MVQQQLHDLERAGLGAVVQRRVALHALAVDVRRDVDEVFGDVEVALVAGDHQARVPVAIGDLNVSIVFHEVLDDVEVTVKASCSEGGGVGLRCGVDVGGLP